MSNENLLNYCDTDFDNLVAQLTQRLQDNSTAWADSYRSSTGQTLIELFSYVGNMLLYYIERRAEESYIDTAQLKSSVVNLVRLLNYTPTVNVSSTGVLKFTLLAPHAKNVYIPKWTECQTSDNKFVTTADVSIIAGGSSITVNATQGYKSEFEVTSNGDANQEDKLDNASIENSSVAVYVDGVLWTKVTSFISSVSTSLHYRLRYELDGTFTVLYGDGIRGKIPPATKTKLYQFIVSAGTAGNVFVADAIDTINSAIFDSDGVEVSDIEVTNDNAFLGGSDPQTTEEIRYNAPRVFSTGDRAVTKADYIAILEDYAGIASANVWGEAEETSPDYDLFNLVRIVIILDGWGIADSTFKSALATMLYDKAQITVKYEFIDPTILEVIPVMSVKVLTGFSLSQTASDIEDALDLRFVLGDTTSLGEAKRLSDLVSVVEALDGINYHHMTLEVKKDLVENYDSTYDYGEILDAVDVLQNSARLFINDVQVASDNGSGTWTDTSSTYTITGVIDYVTGVVGVYISPSLAPSDSVYVRYQQDENGDVVASKNQVCRLDSVDIVSITY